MVSIQDINAIISTTPVLPDLLGRFGKFGGKYVPETLMPALTELEAAFNQYCNEPSFQAQLQNLLRYCKMMMGKSSKPIQLVPD